MVAVSRCFLSCFRQQSAGHSSKHQAALRGVTRPRISAAASCTSGARALAGTGNAQFAFRAALWGWRQGRIWREQQAGLRERRGATGYPRFDKIEFSALVRRDVLSISRRDLVRRYARTRQRASSTSCRTRILLISPTCWSRASQRARLGTPTRNRSPLRSMRQAGGDWGALDLVGKSWSKNEWCNVRLKCSVLYPSSLLLLLLLSPSLPSPGWLL